jgi:hypothetical protein
MNFNLIQIENNPQQWHWIDQNIRPTQKKTLLSNSNFFGFMIFQAFRFSFLSDALSSIYDQNLHLVAYWCFFFSILAKISVFLSEINLLHLKNFHRMNFDFLLCFSFLIKNFRKRSSAQSATQLDQSHFRCRIFIILPPKTNVTKALDFCFTNYPNLPNPFSQPVPI